MTVMSFAFSQEPMMFSGTLRENVDPLRLYPDCDVMDALTQAGLGSKKLDDDIGVSGAGWSVGEKQLVSTRMPAVYFVWDRVIYSLAGLPGSCSAEEACCLFPPRCVCFALSPSTLSLTNNYCSWTKRRRHSMKRLSSCSKEFLRRNLPNVP
jgi:hypothetical protein